MSSMKLKASKLIQILLSLAFIGVLLYLLSALDIRLVFRTIQGMNKIYFTLGVLSLLSSIAVKSYRFGLVNKYYTYPLRYFEAFFIQIVGISIAIMTPARVGEGSKALLLYKRRGVPISTAFGIVVFERFFDMIFLLTGAFLFSTAFFDGRATTLIGIGLGILVILFILFLRHFNMIRWLIPTRFREHFQEVKHTQHSILPLFIMTATAITWLLEAGLPWMLARSMGINLPYTLVFGVVCISIMAVVVSILPAGAGTMDLSFLVLMPLLGVTRETALSILLVYRTFGTLMPFVLSFIMLNKYGLSFKDIKKMTINK